MRRSYLFSVTQVFEIKPVIQMSGELGDVAALNGPPRLKTDNRCQDTGAGQWKEAPNGDIHTSFLKWQVSEKV